MSYVKRFVEWLTLKANIDDKEKVLNFSEGEVWMSYFGENVGFESCGKNKHFHRPVLILRKFGGYTFYAVPLSTQVKKNNQYYIEIQLKGVVQSAMISQVRLLDARRLHYRKGIISEEDFKKVRQGFLSLFKNEITPPKRGAHKGDL
jgi:mRNA-degrading endonuclease toxin of MazEF toxin-antitoxin module